MARVDRLLILILFSMGILGASLAHALSGITLTKSCPTQASATGTATCTIRVGNLDPDNALYVDSVTNQYPIPGGTVYPIYTCDADPDGDGIFALPPDDGNPGGPDETDCEIVESIASCTGTSVTVVDKALVQGHGGPDGTTPLTGGPVHNAVTFLCSGTPTPGPHTVGHEFSKSCNGPINEGGTATCTLYIRNLDPDHGLQINQVTNQFPFPGGTTSQVYTCLADGDMNGVFTLAASDGSPGGADTTTCDISEVMNQSCVGVTTMVYDNASMSGVDVGTGGPSSGTASAGVLVICEPCGNGVLDSGEQCDAGNNNGGEASCCAANCQYKANGSASCDGNACTRPDTCTNGTCTPGTCAQGSSCTICGGTCSNTGGCSCVY